MHQRPRRRAIALTAVSFGALFLAVSAPSAQPPSARSAHAWSSSRLYTIAGSESQVARLPARAHGVATNRRPGIYCAAALSDGTIVLCANQLYRLENDGRLRPWRLRDPNGTAVRMVPDTLALAPDGSLVAGTDEDDHWVIVRIRADGVVERMGDPGEYPSYVGALSTGGAVVSLSDAHRVVRVADDGVVTPVAGNGKEGVDGDGGRAVDARIGFPEAVVGLPDGGFTFAANGRIRRVTPDGRIVTIAGGGRGWHEGARATKVRLGEVSALAARSGGELILVGARGVLQLGTDGRIETIVPNSDNPTTDGLVAGAGGVHEPEEVTVAPDGGLLVLDGLDDEPRIAMIAPATPARLAVALPPADRRLLRRGRLAVTLTRPADVSVRVRSGRRLVARIRSRTSPAGRTTLRLRIARSDKTHVAQVTARSSDGAVATHRLLFVPGSRLSGTIVDRIMREIGASAGEDVTSVGYECRRRDARRFVCDELEYEDGEFSSRTRDAAHVRLGPDGLVHVGSELYEPRLP
jgi:hypothetical protein